MAKRREPSRYPLVFAMSVLTMLSAPLMGCGIPAIDAAKVQQLTVATLSRGETFCPTEDKPLLVQARMAKGELRATNDSFGEPFDAGELEWGVSPAAGTVKSNRLDVRFIPNLDMTPVLEQDVTLSVRMRKNAAAAGGLRLAPDFSCAQTVYYGGAGGAPGNPGYSGEYGGAGANGTNGGRGEDAMPLEVTVKLINTSKRGPLAAVHVSRPNDGASGTFFVEPTRGRITVDNRGGRGGDGGDGGDGGRGADAEVCKRGRPGGPGGNGGYGGDGGNGGPVTVRIDASHPELRDVVSVDNRGGSGGNGGSGGRGGRGSDGGADTKQKCDPPRGTDGRGGDGGDGGNAGHAGPPPNYVLVAQDISF